MLLNVLSVYIGIFVCGAVCELTMCCFFFQAEDGIRDLVRSRGLGDVYKRQAYDHILWFYVLNAFDYVNVPNALRAKPTTPALKACLLYTSDAADDLLCVDLGGRRIIKKKKSKTHYE